jgi:hypothetical protein
LSQPEITAAPKAAALADLAECLQLLGNRPLKLIAETAQIAFHESVWNDSLWKFSRSADTVADKKLLPFPEDSFQFSVANEQSKQDFHLHTSILEIYASNFPIELVYEKGGAQERLSVPSGVLIVPPGVAHRVSLQGLTFVFQTVMGGGSVHNDKVMVDPPAAAGTP